MKKAFTLTELVVAVAILAMLISSAGLIFKVSVKTQRTTLANAEIMNKFRTVINQLNSDFQNIRKDAPLFVWFDYHNVDFDDDGTADTRTRFDEIMFFTAGDFHSTQLYDFALAEAIPRPEPLDGRVVRGNTARIFYGQGQVYSPSTGGFLNPWEQSQRSNNTDTTRNITARTLARRRHVFNSNLNLVQWPETDLDGNILDSFVLPENGGPYYVGEHTNIPYNDFLEHDSLSIAKWRTVQADEYRDENILTTCFDNRALFDREDPNTYHNLLAENIAQFQIQWGYWNDGHFPYEREIRWFPSPDPNDNGSEVDDSHFLHQSVINNDTGSNEGSNAFGTFFNIPNPANNMLKINIPDRLKAFYQWNYHYWLPISKTEYRPYNRAFKPDFFPKALKFTFTIYDSKGVIENGKTFTHIIYLDD